MMSINSEMPHRHIILIIYTRETNFFDKYIKLLEYLDKSIHTNAAELSYYIK